MKQQTNRERPCRQKSSAGVEQLARAKINLALHVTGRRKDGFHLLDSLVVFADCGDKLHLRPADQTSLEISGSFADGLSVGNDNLILKAFKILSDNLDAPLPATAIRLEKNLPVSSGIGGGSADAAATLNGLLDLWQIDMAKPKLAEIALSLGADVPVCLDSTTCRMRGIGEDLVNFKRFPSIPCVLVNAGVAVSTPEVFKQLSLIKDKPAFSPLPDFPQTEWTKWLTDTRNDLQEPAIALTPKIADTLSALTQGTNCQLARMSGSGATCFGLFNNSDEAQNAAAQIASKHPDWWVAPTMLS